MELSGIAKIVIAQGVITVFALLVAYLKLKQEIKKFKEQKVYELKLERLKTQLSDFYGPLHMIATATKQIAQTAWGTDIWEDAWKEIIVPSHLEAERILLTRIHLLDEDEIPKSYLDFLKYSKIAQSYLKTGMNRSYFEKESHYPTQFNEDIFNSYQKKRKEYLELLESA